MTVVLVAVFVAVVLASWTVAGLLVAAGLRLWRSVDHTPRRRRVIRPSSSSSLAAAPAVPDMGAFLAGVELQIFIVLFAIASVLIVNWIVGIMRSSR